MLFCKKGGLFLSALWIDLCHKNYRAFVSSRKPSQSMTRVAQMHYNYESWYWCKCSIWNGQHWVELYFNIFKIFVEKITLYFGSFQEKVEISLLFFFPLFLLVFFFFFLEEDATCHRITKKKSKLKFVTKPETFDDKNAFVIEYRKGKILTFQWRILVDTTLTKQQQ